MLSLPLAVLLAMVPATNDLASSLTLPDGPGSVRGLADRPEVDAFTG